MRHQSGSLLHAAAEIWQVAGKDEIVPARNRCAIALRRFTARVLRERAVRDVAIFDSRGAARAQQGQMQERRFTHHYPLGLAARQAFTAFKAPDTWPFTPRSE